MADYISLEECIKDLREYEKTAFSGLTVIGCMSRIKRLPVADVRPVVLCRDCQFFHNGYDEKCCINHRGVVVTDENGYCHHGKRRLDNG